METRNSTLKIYCICFSLTRLFFIANYIKYLYIHGLLFHLRVSWWNIHCCFTKKKRLYLVSFFGRLWWRLVLDRWFNEKKRCKFTFTFRISLCSLSMISLKVGRFSLSRFRHIFIIWMISGLPRVGISTCFPSQPTFRIISFTFILQYGISPVIISLDDKGSQ